MAAVKALFKASSTQSRLDDVQKRLAATNQELDALSILSSPTSDLDAEEAAALKRLARREALSRVSSALSAEQAELMDQIAQEREAARIAKEARLKADVAAEKAKTVEGLWVAYQLTQPWLELNRELDTISPQF